MTLQSNRLNECWSIRMIHRKDGRRGSVDGNPAKGITVNYCCSSVKIVLKMFYIAHFRHSNVVERKNSHLHQTPTSL